MAKKLFLALMASVLILGLFVLLFPQLNGFYISHKMQGTINSYVKSGSPHGFVDGPPQPDAPGRPCPAADKHCRLWEDMVKYNEKIWEEKQSGLSDTWAYEAPSFCLTDYGFDSEVFGIITIPEMDLEMPLYLGATSRHMADGAAQLSQTSLPIGGDNTNCVIAGHRGWYGAPYFGEIQKLKKDDEVTVQNPWQTLLYKVLDIRIIAPDDVDAVRIRKNRDLLTLLTCHPYASGGGSKRYIVICERYIPVP